MLNSDVISDYLLVSDLEACRWIYRKVCMWRIAKLPS